MVTFCDDMPNAPELTRWSTIQGDIEEKPFSQAKLDNSIPYEGGSYGGGNMHSNPQVQLMRMQVPQQQVSNMLRAASCEQPCHSPHQGGAGDHLHPSKRPGMFAGFPIIFRGLSNSWLS